MDIDARDQHENDELRRRLREADATLVDSRQRLSFAQQAARAGIWEWDIQTGEIVWTKELYRLFGVDPEKARAGFDAWRTAIHPDDREVAGERIESAIANRTPLASEYRIVLPSGDVRWIAALGDTTYDDRGAPLRMSGICIDVTARKRAEEALRESERRFQQVTESLPQLVWTCLPDGPCDYLSPQWVSYTGIPARQQLGYGWLEQLHPDDREPTMAAWRVAATAGSDFAVEFRIRRHDGAYRWFRTLAVPLRDGDGRTVRWFGSNTDIQDLKEAEHARRESESRLRFALESSHTGAWDLDLTDHTIDRSPEHDLIFGYQELLPAWTYEMLLEHVLPEDRGPVDAGFRQAVATRGDWRLECRIRRRDGEVRWIWAAGRHRTDLVGRSRITGIVQDITERMEAEETARTRLLEIEDLYRSAPVGLCVLDRDLRYVRINSRLAEINGVPVAAHIGKRVRDVLPELADVVEPEMQRILDTGEPRLDVEVASETPAQPGVRRTWLEQWLPITDAQGRVTRLSIVVEETTARKRAEEALRTQRLLLETMIDHIPAAVTLIRGEDLTLRLANPAYKAIAPGIEMVGKTLDELWPDTGQDFAAICRRVLETGETYERVDEPNLIRREPGGPLERRYFSWSLSRVHLPEDEGWGLLNVAWETTSRKAAEETLRRAEEERKVAEAVRAERQRLFVVLETLPAMICLLTPDYQVAFASRRFREAFGESQGRRCHEYCFGRPAPCEFCRTYDVLKTGKPQRWEVTTPSGAILDVHDLPFTDVDGSPMILEMAIEITERRRVEDDLRRAHGVLAERAAQLRALADELTRSEQRERRRLARLLHDHLQQLLVAAKYRTAALSAIVGEPTKTAAAEIEQLLDSGIAAARTLTAEISPPLHPNAGLPERLSWLARWMETRHGLQVNLTMPSGLPNSGEDVDALLFESVRELLFNVVKHARVESAGVEVGWGADRALRITVTDDGLGFDPAVLRMSGDASVGFGLLSIRERLELVGGRIEIDSAPGRGSRFTLTAPVDDIAPQAPPDASAAPAAAAALVAAGPVPTRPDAAVRVLIVDDHAVVREGLKQLLRGQTLIHIVGEGADGREAIERADRLRPDVILMDVSMPILDGVEATRAIGRDHPEIRVIGLSMFEDEERERAMLDAGAVAYLSKGAPSHDIVDAIRRYGRRRATG